MNKEDMIALADYLNGKEISKEILERLKEKANLIRETISLQDRLQDINDKMSAFDKKEEKK